jgi:glycerophosphoryl diester phosphodiesterase
VRTLVIPHSGGDALFPEDTLFAYEQSIGMGGDVVDIDVQTSADGIPVAIHDATVDRTTNGNGSVSSLTYKQLARLDAGYKFKTNGKYPFRGKNIRIPTLQSILKKFPKTLVTIDLKDLRIEAVLPLCELITRLHRDDDTYIGVDTNEQVQEFRRRCPNIYTSGTDEERRASRAARESGDLTFRSNQLVSQPPFIADDGTRRVTPQTLNFSHRMNTAVLTWVVDDPKQLKELIDLGVDGIYTRRPDILLKLLRK